MNRPWNQDAWTKALQHFVPNAPLGWAYSVARHCLSDPVHEYEGYEFGRALGLLQEAVKNGELQSGVKEAGNAS